MSSGQQFFAAVGLITLSTSLNSWVVLGSGIITLVMVDVLINMVNPKR